jgi:perosamine synthetase
MPSDPTPSPAAVVDAIRAALPNLPPGARTALHEPCFAGNEWAYVKECLDSGWVSTAGTFVARFERMLEQRTGARHAVATITGSAALHAALLVAGIRAGDEVIVPSLTFIATANAVSYCGATPHLVDIAADTLGLDPLRLERHLVSIAERRAGELCNRATGRPIRAVVAMHTFGHPVDLDPLIEICRDFGLILIEDAAEAIGTLYKERPVGRDGRLSTLSFNGNKTITTGGGGAILTEDTALAAAARHLTGTARLANGWRFDHDQIGYNYKMPSLNAALGCAQLEQLDGFLARKRDLAQRYQRAFANMAGARIFVEPRFAQSNYWLNALLLDKADPELRDAILTATNAAGLGARPAWTLMHQLPIYRDCPRAETMVAEDIEGRLINVPSSPIL